MTIHRYPRRALLGDYARAAVGLAVGLGALIAIPPAPAIVAIFGGLSVLFFVFALRTVQRQMLQVAVTGEGISSVGLGRRTLTWAALERLSLRYYGTQRQQRQRQGGFLQLTLRGNGQSLRLDSTIDGFEDIARRAAHAARANGIALDATSASNLVGLGIDAAVADT